jgi:hypothetical protein
MAHRAGLAVAVLVDHFEVGLHVRELRIRKSFEFLAESSHAILGDAKARALDGLDRVQEVREFRETVKNCGKELAEEGHRMSLLFQSLQPRNGALQVAVEQRKWNVRSGTSQMDGPGPDRKCAAAQRRPQTLEAAGTAGSNAAFRAIIRQPLLESDSKQGIN